MAVSELQIQSCNVGVSTVLISFLSRSVDLSNEPQCKARSTAFALHWRAFCPARDHLCELQPSTQGLGYATERKSDVLRPEPSHSLGKKQYRCFLRRRSAHHHTWFFYGLDQPTASSNLQPFEQTDPKCNPRITGILF